MQIRMLREIDAMFDGVPQSRKTLEIKEEMLQNLMEKYNDLIRQGKSEEAAFNIALASIGDISDLRETLMAQEVPQVARFDGAQGGQDAPREDVPVDPRHHRASVVAVAVMLYIVSPVPVILIGGKMGILLLFTMIAAATGLLIFNGMMNGSGLSDRVQTREDDEPRKMSKKQKRFFGSLSSALWMATVALYFVISFWTGAWHISWIIFLVAAAANNVMKAFIDLYRE